MHNKRSGRVTGCIIIERRKGPDVYSMKARDRKGDQQKRVLGPAWPKSKRAKAPPGYVTEKEAEDALREFLADLGRAPDRPAGTVTLDVAARAWLTYLEHERERKPSTLRDYRNTV